MSKGIIYIMTTAVPGLIKIGKTGSQSFEERMSGLERHGYRNIAIRSVAMERDIKDTVFITYRFQIIGIYGVQVHFFLLSFQSAIIGFRKQLLSG